RSGRAAGPPPRARGGAQGPPRDRPGAAGGAAGGGGAEAVRVDRRRRGAGGDGGGAARARPRGDRAALGGRGRRGRHRGRAVRQAAVEALNRLDLTEVTAAARALAPRVRAGGLLQTFGSGHSQLLALEGFYRAGGPAWLRPLVDDRLSPVRGFSVTRYERSV